MVTKQSRLGRVISVFLITSALVVGCDVRRKEDASVAESEVKPEELKPSQIRAGQREKTKTS
jgi:hypothetical protein